MAYQIYQADTQKTAEDMFEVVFEATYNARTDEFEPFEDDEDE